MPVINFSYSDLRNLVGGSLDYATLVEKLPMMGADVHSVSRDSDEMAFEIFPDRPDMYSVEGIARGLRAFLGISPGLRKYEVGKSDVILKVDPAVDTVRPYIWSALVTDVVMSDNLIKSVMDLQEKLHLTVGRNRRKVAIGIHDHDTVKPPFTYTAVGPTERSFFPLQGSREMSLKEILEDHDKGKAFAFVLEGKEKYPIIVDSEDTVLSFPPIINGITTAITENTRNIFVDCTGTDLNALKASVNILVTSLAERGARIKSVDIQKGEELYVAPDLEPWERGVAVEEVRRTTGIKDPVNALCHCLARMGYGAEPNDDLIRVKVPAYRYDILHPADIIEDIAKGYGYERFGGHLPEQSTIARSDSNLDFANVLRRALTGLGYLEVTTLTLTGKQDQFERMMRREPSHVVEVKNPRTEDRTILRVALLPEMLAILRKNKHRDLPQRIFEVGDVVVDLRNSGRVAGLSIHAKAGFTEMKAVVESVLRSVGLGLRIAVKEDPSFIKGRCASVLLDGEPVGEFGEIRPEVITAFELGYPVAAFEIRTEPLMKKASASWSG